MNWTSETLDRTLAALRRRRGDTTNVEVKQAAGGVPNLKETVCAFANMPGGGTIILGIDEANGLFNVTGITDIAAMDAGITSQVRNSVTPCPNLVSQEFLVDDRPILVIHVSPLSSVDKPAKVNGIAYLRQSDGDCPMNDHELRMLEVDKLHSQERVDYDIKVASGLNENDLVSELVESYIAEVRKRNSRLRNRSREEILRATSVITANGEPTLAGLYALGDYPQGRFPSLKITAAVKLNEGSAGRRNKNLKDFEGPVPVLLQELMEWVSDNLGTEQRYREDGNMVRRPELPLRAIRELIANALIHRDLGPNTLGVGKSIQVRLTERALIIQSPGGLQGLSIAQLESEEHAQAAVNQRLYDIAKKLTTEDGASVIEGEGGGVQEVFRAAAEYGLERPKLVDTGVQFTAQLWRPTGLTNSAQNHPGEIPEVNEPSIEPVTNERRVPHSSSPTRHEETIVSHLYKNSEMTMTDLISATGLKSNQIRYALRPLIAENLVVMIGGQGKKDTKYHLN